MEAKLCCEKCNHYRQIIGYGKKAGCSFGQILFDLNLGNDPCLEILLFGVIASLKFWAVNPLKGVMCLWKHDNRNGRRSPASRRPWDFQYGCSDRGWFRMKIRRCARWLWLTGSRVLLCTLCGVSAIPAAYGIVLPALYTPRGRFLCTKCWAPRISKIFSSTWLVSKVKTSCSCLWHSRPV